MSSRAVIGLGFGDEGKGVTTDYLCSQYPSSTIVVRFSGGHQAGHKVLKGNIEHVFSSFGAGTLSGCETYWSKNCTVEPVAFMNELNLLKSKGIDPKIFIHPECPVTTIYDVFANRNSIDVRHGTTGTGFFRTRKRHFTDGLELKAGLVFYGSWLTVLDKLEQIREYYKIDDLLDINLFCEAVQGVRNHLAKNVFFSEEIPYRANVVFEGSQGLMLHENIGTMPHCTPSDVRPRAILDMGYNLDEVYLVTRAYQTRHGNGPMTNEKYGKLHIFNNEKETNISHQYQGEFRTSILDLDQLIHAKTKGVDEVLPSSVKVNLVVTCLDQISPYVVTHNKKVIAFLNAQKFVEFLGKHLHINGHLYMNNSPHTNSLTPLHL